MTLLMAFGSWSTANSSDSQAAAKVRIKSIEYPSAGIIPDLKDRACAVASPSLFG
jgi:hypothetical protein